MMHAPDPNSQMQCGTIRQEIVQATTLSVRKTRQQLSMSPCRAQTTPPGDQPRS